MKMRTPILLLCLLCLVAGFVAGFKTRGRQDAAEFDRAFDAYQDSVFAKDAIFQLGCLRELRDGDANITTSKIEESLHEKLQALSRYADLPQSARDRSCLLALRKMVEYFTAHPSDRIDEATMSRAKNAL